MKYIITESKLSHVVGNFFSQYVNLDNVSVLWGSYYGDEGLEPATRFIKFVLNNNPDDIVFLGGNEDDEWLDVSNPPTSLYDTPSQEDIARYTVCVFDETMADKFNDWMGEGNWEVPLMHYINHKLGTNFSSFLIEMI